MGNSVQIDSYKKRALLELIAEQAKASGSQLLPALRAYRSQIATPNFRQGKILSATSGSGQHASFEMTTLGKEFTPANIFAVSQQLVEVCVTILNAGLAADTGVPSDTDNLVMQMEFDGRLQGVNEMAGDWTSLNVPALGGLPV